MQFVFDLDGTLCFDRHQIKVYGTSFLKMRRKKNTPVELLYTRNRSVLLW